VCLEFLSDICLSMGYGYPVWGVLLDIPMCERVCILMLIAEIIENYTQYLSCPIAMSRSS
jgi:hypothetical protein